MLFFKKWTVGCSMILLLLACSDKQSPSAQTEKQSTEPLPACEWCGTEEAPENLSWSTRIAPKDAPGEPLVLAGTVYLDNGQSPASDVVIYAYHTNAEGIYPKKGDETGNGQRHGYLRAWVRTNEAGQYRFETIRPAPYPSRGEAAHIHMTLQGPGMEEYWVYSTKFKGDPLLQTEEVEASSERGRFASIIELEQGADGIWRGTRDFILGQKGGE